MNKEEIIENNIKDIINWINKMTLDNQGGLDRKQQNKVTEKLRALAHIYKINNSIEGVLR